MLLVVVEADMYSFPSRGIHAADRRLLESVCFEGNRHLLHFVLIVGRMRVVECTHHHRGWEKALLVQLIYWLPDKEQHIQPFILFPVLNGIVIKSGV